MDKDKSLDLNTDVAPFLDPEVRLFLKNLVDTCPFMGLLIPLFWISGDVSYGFQNQSGQPYSHLSETYIWCIFPQIHFCCNTCWPLDIQHSGRSLFITRLFKILKMCMSVSIHNCTACRFARPWMCAWKFVYRNAMSSLEDEEGVLIKVVACANCYTGTIKILGFILLLDPSTINPIETTSTMFILKDSYSFENNTAWF